jgi:DNA repair exonuclease SbcCD ATPase subunit
MKRKIFAILGYTALVAVVLLLSQCESRVTLTTPKKDAQRIITLAQGIESEEELKSIEKLARKYEIAYERMYNGAASLEFKRLTNDALREASQICDDIHAKNDQLKALQSAFSGSLDMLDAAWSHEALTAKEYEEAIKKNELRVKKINAKIKQAEAEIQAYSDKLIDAGYPAEMLEELGKMKEGITKYESQIAAVESESRVLTLAYKLQGGEVATDPVVEDTLCDEPEPTEAVAE